MIFVDTNVVSEIVNPVASASVLAWIKEHDAKLVISSIVLAEICFGVERTRPDERAKRLIGFPEAMQARFGGKIYHFDDEAAMIYGRTLGEAARRGKLISAQDGMIAAIALRHKATLATRNVSDFEGLGLKLINPWN